MSTARKAAIVLVSLPEEEAGMLMRKFDPPQLEQVCVEIACLNRVTSKEQETVVQEFADSHCVGGRKSGGLEIAKNLVKKALGPRAPAAIENLQQSIEDLPFGFLRHVDSQQVLSTIIDEHPQTIALILSYLSPAFAAEVMAGLSPDCQIAVVRRMATMGQPSPEVIREVELGLKKRMSSVVHQSFETPGGVESVAKLLNDSDRDTERALLEKLENDDPELVQQIRRLMFVFEDIARLDNKDIQAILKNVETLQCSYALKGASDELKNCILGNMSQRASDMLREEMETLGVVKLSTVEVRQQEIVAIARHLEEEGKIEIPTTGKKSPWCGSGPSMTA